MEQVKSPEIHEPTAKRFCNESVSDRIQDKVELQVAAKSGSANHILMEQDVSTTQFAQEHCYQQEIMYNHDTINNVVPANDYHNLKKDHESLKMQFQNMQSHLEQVKSTLNEEIVFVKNENYRMQVKVKQLKKELCENGINLSESILPETDKLDNSTENDENSVFQRLIYLEQEVTAIKSDMKKSPPCPPPAVLEYFIKLAEHYAPHESLPNRTFNCTNFEHQQSEEKTAQFLCEPSGQVMNCCKSDNDVETPYSSNDVFETNDRCTTLNGKDNATQPYDNNLETIEIITTLSDEQKTLPRSTIPENITVEAGSSDECKTLNVPLLPPTIGVMEDSVTEGNNYTHPVNSISENIVGNEVKIAATVVPGLEESSCCQKVQLLPKYGIWVNRTKLTNILQESTSQPTENAPLFVLRRLIPLVFTLEEMAASRGQGITTKSRGKVDTNSSKIPLDPVKIASCKDFMRMFCTQNELVEPSNVAINAQFTHCITYSRNKLKRMSVKSGTNTTINNPKDKGDNNPPCSKIAKNVDNTGSHCIHIDGSFQDKLPEEILTDS